MIRLEQLRLDSRLTVRDLAEKADVSYQTILDLEAGRTRRPQTGTLGKIADALGDGARPSELLGPAREVAA